MIREDSQSQLAAMRKLSSWPKDLREQATCKEAGLFCHPHLQVEVKNKLGQSRAEETGDGDF